MAGHVAARTAAWQRRARNVPGPLAASGEQPTGAPIQVELFVQGSWTDITSYVMTREGNLNIGIFRGQPDQAQETNPGRCALQLNNRDGRFSPRNPTGPYYGFLGRNQPIRVSVPSGNSKAYRFFGEVPAWPQHWDTTGTDVWVEVEAAGILRRLGQGNTPVSSPLYAQLSTGFTPFSETTVVAYWPCEDASGATSVAAGLPGEAAMTVLGTATFASSTTFVGSSALPTFQASTSFTGLVPTYVSQGSVNMRFAVIVPSGGLTDGAVLASFRTSGTLARWDVVYAAASSGGLGLNGYNSAGTSVFSGAAIGSSLNGAQAIVTVLLSVSGADTFVAFGWDNIGVSPITGFGSVPSPVSGQAFGSVTSVTIAPNAGLTNTVFGHVIVDTQAGLDPTSATDSSAIDSLAQGYNGEWADARVSRLCNQVGLNYEQIGNSTFFDAVNFNLVHLTTSMGAQTRDAFLNLVKQCTTADAGILYEPLAQLGIGFRTRASLENQTAALTLDYPSNNLSEVPTPLDDDRYTRNDITVSRTNGSSYRVQQTTGSLSVAQPPAGVGPYPDSVALNVSDDASLADQAGWRLSLGTVDEARYPVISVNLAHASFVAAPVLREQVLAVRLGDRIVVTNPPTWLPPDPISQLVLSVSETIDKFQHKITFVCAPESPYHTAVLEDAVLSRLDTGGSQTASPAQPADTTLSVATTTGPIWTTSAGDFPFDIVAGGERMTVTNITGAASPQTFTVTRSVNGVVKAQTVGTAVSLYQPMILPM